MASGKIAFTELKGWIDDYKASINGTGETRNCLLSLAELRSLMTYIDNQNIYIKDKIDGVRVYFIRENPPQYQSKPVTLKTGEVVNQMSIAIVPTFKYSNNFECKDDKGKDVPCYGADDYKEVNDEIYVVRPGGVISEHSGLCPPNCGGGQ